jgi:FixJ family two-component response regulator
MKAGAFDFMTRPIEDNQLTALVARGYAIFYDVDWDFVGEDLDDIEKSLRRFTDREREILDLVVDGFSSREIAEQLGISPKTVEAHRARITDKMRSDSLAHLVRKMMVYNDNQ